MTTKTTDHLLRRLLVNEDILMEDIIVFISVWSWLTETGLQDAAEVCLVAQSIQLVLLCFQIFFVFFIKQDLRSLALRKTIT